MAYDETLAERVRHALATEPDMDEKKMFGGLAFMKAGNMACGVVGDELMVRVGPDLYHDALTREHAREMDFTGKPMKGMVFVGADGVRSDDGLEAWIRLGLAYASSLPPK